MNLFSRLAMGALTLVPLSLTSCNSVAHSFKETHKLEGFTRYQGIAALIEPISVKFYICNNAIPVKENDWGGVEFNIDGRKSVFIDGEPIKVVLNCWGNPVFCSGLGNGSTGLTKLLTNGEVDLNRNVIYSPDHKWNYRIIDYTGISPGNHTVVHYGGTDFMGKIDFEVVPKPSDEPLVRR